MTLNELLGESYREGMTLDEVNAALANVQMPNDSSKEVERLKNAITKSNAEAAEYKRKLREKQTDDEARAAETESKQKELEEKYNLLLKESTVSKHRARLLAQGYSEELADSTANAIYDGNMDAVFDAQKRFVEEHDKALKAQLMRETPKPNAGGSSGVVGTDYSKLIANAQSMGDMASVAAFMRLQQENNNK